MSQAGTGFEAEVERVARRQRTGWRSPLLLAVVAGVSLWLAWGYRAELAYFFADDTPVDLGEAYEVPDGLHNAYVRAEGLPSRLQAGYEQLGRRYRVYFLLGTRVFVREPLPEDTKSLMPEDGSYPTFEGSGRLLDLGEADTYANVRQFFEQRAGWSFDEKPTWLLLEGVEPRSQWQYPLLVGVLLAIAGLNLVLLVRRLLRR